MTDPRERIERRLAIADELDDAADELDRQARHRHEYPNATRHLRATAEAHRREARAIASAHGISTGETATM
jgi:hypothetical protein